MLKIGDLLNDALDGLFGFVLPDEVQKKIVDPVTDALGAGLDGLTGRPDGAAKHLLDLAEDLAQWAGKNELARKIDEAAKVASMLLEPPLARERDLFSAAREAGARAAGAAAGALAAGLARRDAEGVLGYARVGAGVASTDLDPAEVKKSAKEHGILGREAIERAKKVAGAAAGMAAGGALGGERGMKVGLDQGTALAARLESLTHEDLDSFQVASKAVGTATHLGGIAVGLYLASEWSVWRRDGTSQPNFDAAAWAAGAGASVEGMLGARQVTGGLGQAARAAELAVRGARIHGERAEAAPRARGLVIAEKILEKAPGALEWLGRPPVRAPEVLDEQARRHLLFQRSTAEEVRRRQMLEIPA
jgi:hypothetical protein